VSGAELDCSVFNCKNNDLYGWIHQRFRFNQNKKEKIINPNKRRNEDEIN